MDIQSKHQSKIIVVLLLGLTMVLGASLHEADKIDDFKEAQKAAKEEKGCESIPYGDLRSTCISQRGEVHDWCDGKRGPVSCENERITRDLTDRIEREKATLVGLKDKKSKLENDRSRASDQSEKDRLSKEIDQVGNEIYNQDKVIYSAIGNLEMRKKLVGDAIYTLERCLNYREALMYVFATAQDRVRGETEAPIVPIARELRDYYESTKRGHAIAVENKKNALATCKNSR